MFTTFTADPNIKPDKATPALQPKRNQVARACDWCRLSRIKCDNDQPCQNCRQRGARCSNSRFSGIKSMAAAMKEIQRLTERVNSLEGQLAARSKDAESSTTSKVDIEAAKTYQNLPQRQIYSQNRWQQQGTEPAVQEQEKTQDSAPTTNALSGNPHTGWEGFLAHDSQNDSAVYYGPLSISQLGSRLYRHLQQTQGITDLPHAPRYVPAIVSQVTKSVLADSPSSLRYHNAFQAFRQHNYPHADAIDFPDQLQEEQILGVLWQSFNAIYPIVSEPEFRSYYDNLWSCDQAPGRKPSALVDGMLAVATQYSSSFFQDDHNSIEDLHVANKMGLGLSFYERSVRIFMGEMEYPSLITLQSSLYCIIYLQNSAFHNAASSMLGISVRLAHALRLHLAPPSTIDPDHRALHARIWWTLYQLDSALSITLGRPPLIHPDNLTCTLSDDTATDSHDPPLSEQENFRLTSYRNDIGYNTFHLQYVHLTAIVRDVHSAFHARCNQYLASTKVNDIYEDGQNLEVLAKFLNLEARKLLEWTHTVPKSLQIQRKAPGEPFSTDRTSIALDTLAPLWLQRQRLLLEIIYHDFQISIFHTFIRFNSRPSLVTTVSDQNGILCLNHAVAMTSLLDQVVLELDVLRGWAPIVQYQWNATLCIASFIIAYPLSPFATGARQSLQKAIRILKFLGQYCAGAQGAAQIASALRNLAETSAEPFRTKFNGQCADQNNTAVDTTGFRLTSGSENSAPARAASATFSSTIMTGSMVDMLNDWDMEPHEHGEFDVARSVPLQTSL